MRERVQKKIGSGFNVHSTAGEVMAGEKPSPIRNVSPHAVNESDAVQLWRVTEEMLRDAS